jgi:lipopolysaccharide export LptBFGC system permease protein LptF
MGGPHEQLEHAEHVEHAGHGNKKIALLIAILALGLAFSETLGKASQTEGISLNIKASDTWNFFQAKTIRQTTLRTAAQAFQAEANTVPDEPKKAVLLKQADDWMKTVARYDSDPKEKDGRKELRELAEKYEHERDVHLARYHSYEYSSAAYQIGIVLASAAVITGMVALVYGSIGLGILGLIFTGMGLLRPEAPHEVMHWLEHLFTASGTH